MAHKTAHRKSLEASNKAKLKAKAGLLADAKNDVTLKANAAKRAKKL